MYRWRLRRNGVAGLPHTSSNAGYGPSWGSANPRREMGSGSRCCMRRRPRRPRRPLCFLSTTRSWFTFPTGDIWRVSYARYSDSKARRSGWCSGSAEKNEPNFSLPRLRGRVRVGAPLVVGQNLQQRKNQAANGEDQPKDEIAARPLSESLDRLVAAGWIFD